MRKFLFSLILLLLMPGDLEAKDYAVFDGQKYNGRYYPLIENIEWGKPPHMELHIHSKDEPIDIEAKVIERGGKRVILINYFFTKRKEKVCRSVLAPANFSPDAKLFMYKDATDKDYDNIYLSMTPITSSKNIVAYASKPFTTADCSKDDESDSTNTQVTDTGSSTNKNEARARNVASSTESDQKTTPPTSPSPEPPTPEKKLELINYENNALPYNF